MTLRGLRRPGEPRVASHYQVHPPHWENMRELRRSPGNRLYQQRIRSNSICPSSLKPDALRWGDSSILEQEMSRGQNPLVLMMALSLPGAAHALGLGEIHVNSALNEPLAAEIDILGATAEELSSLTASIANKDTFLRFSADRPAFLASATFKVSHDVKGRPVLVIRSTESFTEPVVNLLVDLRWHNGEVIRQYSLLLDPTGFPAATQVAAVVRSPVVPLATLVAPAAAPAPAPEATNALAAVATQAASADATASPAARTTRTTTHVKIGAKATLRGVAWRVGARSDSDLKKTMLAIFRANPNAF